MCLHTHVHNHECNACFFTMAQTGVNNNCSKSYRYVTGKQDENSQLVLAGCGCLHAMRPGCCQALCRWNDAMGCSRAKDAPPSPDRLRCDLMNPNHPGHPQNRSGAQGAAQAWARRRRSCLGSMGKGTLQHLVLDWTQMQNLITNAANKGQNTEPGFLRLFFFQGKFWHLFFT